MKRTTIQMIWLTVIVILVLMTSAYTVYAFDMRMTTTRSIVDKSYNETGTNNHTTVLGPQEYDSDIKRKTVNLEVINRSEIPNGGRISSEFIASLIDRNLTIGDSNRVKSDPDFILIDNQSGIIGYALPSFWNIRSEPCDGNFTCKVSTATGWRDDMSLQVSTKGRDNTMGSWSWIYGKDVGVNPKERYELVTHMKLNKFVEASHVAFQVYNGTGWYPLGKQCPPGTNGPLEWHQFGCELRIPENATKIRPILNAGWSSQPNKEATTWFDDVYMIRLPNENTPSDVPTIIHDPNLKIEVVAVGLDQPTSMAFLDPDDILVLEKNKGTIQRIKNGAMLSEPLLDLNVGYLRERGILGIAVAANNENGYENGTSPNSGDSTHVFLYLTESKYGDTYKPEPLRNRLYRYDLENNKLVNPKLLMELPLTSTSIHNGGKVLIGPDNNLYTVVGDLDSKSNTKAQNIRDGAEPEGTSGILGMTQDGLPVNDTGILGDEHPLDLYYAYGIRNSFGLDFDPVTGMLWDTENGPGFGDEINLVEPGFNSGWSKITGKLQASGVVGKSAVANTLEDFDGNGKYSDPEYEWSQTVGPTALKFLNSDKLGKQYENDMFVGDFNNGNIYHFELNKERTKLNIDSALLGSVNEKIIFAKGFSQITSVGGVTDIQVGPDGYLYIASYGQGKIFRIVPRALQ